VDFALADLLGVTLGFEYKCFYENKNQTGILYLKEEEYNI
jgi:hypothetical protein